LAMDGCAQMCKCFLILFNILFALVGLGLVGLGMWLRFGAETRGFFDIDLNTAQFNIVMVLVVTGVLMLLVAIIGDCGACNNSKSALGVFSGLLTVLIIIEITAGVMAFMCVCVFQFDCCGVGGPIEVIVRNTCPKGSFLEQLTYSSCPGAIKDVFNSKAQLVLGGFLGTAGIMIIVCLNKLFKKCHFQT
uniref:Tetraspanin n=1 Tax=Cyprinus carpio TaxID=7962 RepID=A0A8C1NNS9_CYPCA